MSSICTLTNSQAALSSRFADPQIQASFEQAFQQVSDTFATSSNSTQLWQAVQQFKAYAEPLKLTSATYNKIHFYITQRLQSYTRILTNSQISPFFSQTHHCLYATLKNSYQLLDFLAEKISSCQLPIYLTALLVGQIEVVSKMYQSNFMLENHLIPLFQDHPTLLHLIATDPKSHRLLSWLCDSSSQEFGSYKLENWINFKDECLIKALIESNNRYVLRAIFKKAEEFSITYSTKFLGECLLLSNDQEMTQMLEKELKKASPF